MKSILFLLILFSCCRSALKNENRDSDTIVFAVINIHKSSTDSKSIMNLVSTTQTAGKLKIQNQNPVLTDNYLSVYVYNNKKLIDSMSIEHPLYKHIEYWTADNTFAVKDTILDQSEFFIRFQTSGDSNELKISETIKNKTIKDQTILKLY